MDLGNAQIGYDNKEPEYLDPDKEDAYITENLDSEIQQVKSDCLNEMENAAFDVNAMFDESQTHEIIRAVCISMDSEGIAEIARKLVSDAVKMVAEEQLTKKFERGEA